MGVDRTRDRGSWRRGNEQHDCHPDDPPASRRRSVVLHVLGLLAASLAAVAALFLIQTALTLLMTVAFVTLLIAGFDWRSNTYSWSSAGIDAEPFTEGRRQLLSRISGALLRCGKSAFRPPCRIWRRQRTSAPASWEPRFAALPSDCFPALRAVRGKCIMHLPQIVEPMRCGSCVVGGMPRIPVPEVILD